MSRINGVVGGVVRPVVRGLTSNKGVGVPAGYTRTTYNGVPVSYGNRPVFDDGKNFYYLRAA